MKTQEMSVGAECDTFSLKRILVPVDFSPLSIKALHYATQFAKEFRTEVDLVHVLEPEVPPTFDGYMISRPMSILVQTEQNKKNS